MSFTSFVFKTFQRVFGEGQRRHPLDRKRTYQLLLVLQGTLEVTTGARKQTIGQGACFCLAPNSEAAYFTGESDSEVWQFAFEVSAEAGDARTAELLQKLTAVRYVSMARLLAAIQHVEKESGQQRDILSLLSLLCDQEIQEYPFDPQKAVEDTIRFLHRHYNQAVTVQQLADMANLPRWHYLRLFKKRTGSTPSSYMTSVRIEQAKALLSDSTASIREIAHKVGYDDEHYFNRRFKKETGIAPGQYARIYQGNAFAGEGSRSVSPVRSTIERIVYDDAGTLGDLLALGISPVGANLRFAAHIQLVRRLPSTQEIGCPINVEKVRSLQPDLVLLSRYGCDQYHGLSAIAPTIGLNEYAPMQRRIQKLGEVLGMREQADQWLHQYERKCGEMWQRLQSYKKSDETATVLFYDWDGRLYLLHRMRGLAKLLYHPLGFRMDERVQHLRPARGHYFIAVEREHLAQMAGGDRLFIFVRTPQQIKAAIVGLNQWPGWKDLPAVRSGNVHYLDGFWNLDDAFTSVLALEQFPAMWT